MSKILKVTINNGIQFRKIIETFREEENEINIKFGYITRMRENDECDDIPCVEFFDDDIVIRLGGKKFKKFHCPNEVTLTLDLFQLWQIIKKVTRRDFITLTIFEDEQKRIAIKISGDKDKYDASYFLKVNDINVSYSGRLTKAAIK